jgi:three-Cys-motif partner protein
VAGSPLNALLVQPPFKEYFLIDLAPDKVASLRGIVGDRPDVHVLPGDCNTLLLEEVFRQVRWADYRRGLCLLDPYGLDLDWRVMGTAGGMGSIEMFLNFPVMDMNRNVLWRDLGKAHPLVTEEFAQEELALMSAAVDGHARSISALAESLNRGGDQFLPGPRLTP